LQRGELNTAGDYINAAISDGVHPWQQDWTLDARGNWNESNTITPGQSNFKLETQPNGVNELEEITRHWGQLINTTQPAYDPAGNLTNDPTAPNLSGIDGQQYEYDEENRLTSVRDSAGALLQEIAYDALGRRVESKDYTAAAQCGFGPPVVTRHLMAGLHTLEEHIQCSGSTWTLAREFIWGDRFPEPVAMVTHGGTSGGFGGPSVPSGTSVYYYLHHVLGSVIGLANAAGQLVERYTYDPYGKTRVLTASGTTPMQRPAYGNPFAWTGQRLDAATGMYHFLFRSHSPSLGKWLQRDPAEYADGPSLYESMRSDPVDEVDPFGLNTFKNAGALDPDERANFANGLGKRPCDNKGTLSEEQAQRGNELTDQDLSNGLKAFRKGAWNTLTIIASVAPIPGEAWIIRLIETGGKRLWVGIRWSAEGVERVVELMPFEMQYFRENLFRLTRFMDPLFHAHHIIPQKYRDLMRKTFEINIDDPRLGRWWKSDSHLEFKDLYQALWDDFIEKRAKTREDVLEFAEFMDNKFRRYYGQ